jgi:hypothetical protein
MGMNKYSAGSFEEMAEQNEASEVKTPVAATSPEATPVAEAVATKPVTEEPPVASGNFVSEDNTKTSKTE